jgi:hypothetical protein
MANGTIPGRPSFPLSGTVKMDGGGCYLCCPDGTAYTLWRSSPPTAAPDSQAAPRACTYLHDVLNKTTGDPLTVTDGWWPFAAPSNVLCIVSAE